MSQPYERALRRSDPFRELDDLRQRMFQLLEGTLGEPVGSSWSPLVDVEETEGAYVFEADVPGAAPDDVSVEVDGNELRISGEVRRREPEGIVRRQARPRGRFEYRTALPRRVDADRIQAKLGEGVLTVRAPKSERSRPRRIAIASGPPQSPGADPAAPHRSEGGAAGSPAAVAPEREVGRAGEPSP